MGDKDIKQHIETYDHVPSEIIKKSLMMWDFNLIKLIKNKKFLEQNHNKKKRNADKSTFLNCKKCHHREYTLRTYNFFGNLEVLYVQ